MVNIARSLIAGAAVLASTTCFAEPPLNPDVNAHNIGSTICVRGYTKEVRPPVSYTNPIKKRLMREAGIPLSDIHDYELDHIVPLALAGCPRCLDNLQLQPWDGPDGAHKKDRLEVKLQCLVCTGEVALAEAQNDIYADWKRPIFKIRSHEVPPAPVGVAHSKTATAR